MDRHYGPPHHPHPPPHDLSSAQHPASHATPSNALPGFPPPPGFPSAAQPPVQIPFSDPFHNRDPFLPPTQHRRADSYGSHMKPERAWTTQPGPTTHAGLPQAQYAPAGYQANDANRPAVQYEHARRRSLGGATSPPRYRGPLDPPPPPHFASRNMPPPSPSPAGISSFSNGGHRPPPISHFHGPQEQAPGAPRSGGGISITSLIGSDRPPRAEYSPKAMTTHNSPTMRPSHALSPKRARSTSVRSEMGRPPPRQPSPRSHHFVSADPRDERERQRYDHVYPHAPSSAPSFRPYQSSPTSDQFPPGAQRPISQPINQYYPDPVDAWRFPHQQQRQAGAFREYHAPVVDGPGVRNDDARYESPRFDRPSLADPRQTQPMEQYPSQTRYAERDWQSEQRYAQNDHHEYQANRSVAESRHIGAPAPASPAAEKTVFESRFRHYAGPTSEQEDRYTPHLARKDDDGNPMARSHLTVSPELNRKGGRSSPLPQAVQGAQPQLMGPGRDPSVKIEFGRMFGGLGSGVGGSGTPNGPFSATGNVTPSRMSPSRFVDGDAPVESESIVNGQSVLHQQGQHEPPRDHSPAMTDGRDTPTLPNGKRAKTVHPSHHHHHHNQAHNHGHAHHHHHHHHAAAEDNIGNKTGFSTIRFPAAGNSAQDTTPKPAHHHHHHHHGTNHAHGGHHHHHVPPPGNAQAAATTSDPTPSQRVIRNDSVLSEAAKQPRMHLGSTVYKTSLSLAANKSRNIIDAKALFASTPTALPRFEGRDNCTFTIRVPREYLISAGKGMIAGGLEEICRRCALWGTDIYTDDSDVVAAAVHSGWIRGSFGEDNDNDIRMAFPTEAAPDSVDEALEQMDQKPDSPITLPSNMDMHVTVLVLPPLVDYAGTTRHHVRSRHWAGDHDGMSFMIHAVKFVDEPAWSRFLDRGPKARKARLREELKNRRAS